jgi:hypothetical protein
MQCPGTFDSWVCEGTSSSSDLVSVVVGHHCGRWSLSADVVASVEHSTVRRSTPRARYGNTQGWMVDGGGGGFILLHHQSDCVVSYWPRRLLSTRIKGIKTVLLGEISVLPREIMREEICN